jgi:hypothetical protein
MTAKDAGTDINRPVTKNAEIPSVICPGQSPQKKKIFFFPLCHPGRAAAPERHLRGDRHLPAPVLKRHHVFPYYGRFFKMIPVQ